MIMKSNEKSANKKVSDTKVRNMSSVSPHLSINDEQNEIKHGFKNIPQNLKVQAINKSNTIPHDTSDLSENDIPIEGIYYVQRNNFNDGLNMSPKPRAPVDTQANLYAQFGPSRVSTQQDQKFNSVKKILPPEQFQKEYTSNRKVNSRNSLDDSESHDLSNE